MRFLSLSELCVYFLSCSIFNSKGNKTTLGILMWHKKILQSASLFCSSWVFSLCFTVLIWKPLRGCGALLFYLQISLHFAGFSSQCFKLSPPFHFWFLSAVFTVTFLKLGNTTFICKNEESRLKCPSVFLWGKVLINATQRYVNNRPTLGSYTGLFNTHIHWYCKKKKTHSFDLLGLFW